jgi:hypothetical protein
MSGRNRGGGLRRHDGQTFMLILKDARLMNPATLARFTATEKAALEKAARDDARPVAALMAKIICDWLRERKYLK